MNSGYTHAHLMGVVETISEHDFVIRATRKEKRPDKVLEVSTWLPIEIREWSAIPAVFVPGVHVLVECRLRSKTENGKLVAVLIAERVLLV